MSHQTTRDQICEYLRTHPAASVRELSRLLGLTIPDIRHHLDALIEDGKVECIGQRAAGGRGRPAMYFSLSAPAKPNNLTNLAKALLDELFDDISLETHGARLRSIAGRLAGSPLPGKKNLTSRMNHAVTTLNDMHYQARWEARSDGPQVFISYCPYAAILSNHPELCHLDRYILENILQTPCTQTDRQDPKSEKHPYCVFMVRNR